MRTGTMGVVVSVLLGGFKVAAAAQLPPEIMIGICCRRNR